MYDKAELIYGPKNRYDVRDWTKRFNLIKEKTWVKNFMLNEIHDYEVPYDSDDEEGINIVFCQEFDFDDNNYFDLLTEFLKSQNMIYTMLEYNSVQIGIPVEDYDTFTDTQKQQVKYFCEKYNLQEPTFYAGIV